MTIVMFYSFKTCLEAYQTLVNGQYVTVCTHTIDNSYTTQFNPAFDYTYECSSALLMAYIPVYLYTYTMLAIFPPILYFILAYIPRRFFPKNFPFKIVQILRPQDWNRDIGCPVVLRSNSIQALFIQHITIILTFGMASPFLAVIICISMIINTYGWQYIILRFINHGEMHPSPVFKSDDIQFILMHENILQNDCSDEQMKVQREELNDRLARLESICEESWLSLKNSFWLVFYFCMLFYCFMLFDIVGDAHGLKSAFAIVFVFAGTILFVRFASFDIIFLFRTR